jgi:zinc/manganese transport system permease protein
MGTTTGRATIIRAAIITMLDYDFMRNAFAAAGVAAVVSGLVGYFLVLRGQTFAGHALSHIGFAGATGAVLIGAASPLLPASAWVCWANA